MILGLSALAIHTPGGIGRYARILAAVLLTRFNGELHVFLQRRRDMQTILNELPRAEAERFVLRDEVQLHFSSFSAFPRHMLHQLELPEVFRRLNLDAYLDPDYVLPNLSGIGCHCVIHDTTPYAAPFLMGVKAQLIYRISGPASLRRAKTLICVSKQTRARMVELYPSLEPKLHTVVSCLAPKFSKAGSDAYSRLSMVDVETVHGIVSVPLPFVLHVGVAGPRKNLPALLTAFTEVKLRMLPHRLVIVGGRAKPLPRQDRPLHEIALPDGSCLRPDSPLPDVLHLGRVSDDDLVSLYRHADLLVLPSLEEGFGYPVLEALAFRTPALAANDSPLAHLPGVATITDVRDPASIAAALEDALRRLSDLASEISAGFSIDYYSCDRYLRDLLTAIR